MKALGSAMDEPEDLMQLVLGMSTPNLFDGLFSGAVGVEGERLDEWFDRNSGTLGGESAIKAVRDLVGQAQSFDLSDLKDVPPLDLPDLLPFLNSVFLTTGVGQRLKNTRCPSRPRMSGLPRMPSRKATRSWYLTAKRV
ncbi:hypothetical protein ACU4HD_19450 [Cupriavidus basilensis]